MRGSCPLVDLRTGFAVFTCAAFFTCAALLVASPLAAQEAVQNETPKQAPALVAADTLAKVNQRLQNLPPQSGRFEQVLPNGTLARGSYHMDWPARLRFAYDTNVGGAIVTVKDDFVAVQETPRGEPNWFPVALTPLAVLRRAVAQGIGPAMLVAAEDEADFLALTLRDATGELPGTATLYFAKPGLSFYAWRLVDVQNLTTQLRLREQNYHASLSDRVFDIDYDDDFQD